MYKEVGDMRVTTPNNGTHRTFFQGYYDENLMKSMCCTNPSCMTTASSSQMQPVRDKEKLGAGKKIDR